MQIALRTNRSSMRFIIGNSNQLPCEFRLGILGQESCERTDVLTPADSVPMREWSSPGDGFFGCFSSSSSARQNTQLSEALSIQKRTSRDKSLGCI